MNIGMFFGLLVIAVSILSWYQGAKLKRSCNAFIDGIVVGIEIRETYEKRGRGSYRVTLYCPVVSYKVDNIEYRHVCGGSKQPDMFSEGDKIEICYNSDKPKQCYAVKEMSYNVHIGPIILIIIGIGIIVFSFIIPRLG